MIKLLLISGFVLLAHLSFGQDDKVQKVTWQIGASYAQEFYFSPTKLGSESFIFYDITAYRHSYSVGVHAQSMFNKKYEVGFGLRYADYNIIASAICYSCDLAIPPLDESIKADLLEVPVYFRYHFINKKFGLNAETGFTNSFGKTSETVFLPSDTHYQLIYNVGLGSSVNIGDRSILFLSAIYNHSLMRLNDRSGLKMNYVSVKAGVNIKL